MYRALTPKVRYRKKERGSENKKEEITGGYGVRKEIVCVREREDMEVIN